MIRNDTMCKRNPVTSSCSAVAFDLDGTLYPEHEYAFSGFKAVSRYIHTLYGKHIFDSLAAAYLDSDDRTDVIGRAMRNHFSYVDNTTIRNVTHVFWTHEPSISLFPDARVAIASLTAMNIRTAVITTGPAGSEHRKAAALDLENLVDAVIHTDDLNHNPDPAQTRTEALCVAAFELGTKVADMIFVGDNPETDFAEPAKLGMSTVWIQRRNGNHSDGIPDVGADSPSAIIPSLNMLTEFVSTNRRPRVREVAP